MQYWLSFNEWNINNLFIIYYYESTWRHIVGIRILESYTNNMFIAIMCVFQTFPHIYLIVLTLFISSGFTVLWFMV